MRYVFRIMETNHKTRTRTPEQWRRLLKKWQAGDMTQAAFCRRHKTPVWKFRYWQRKLDVEDHEPQQGFVSVETEPTHSAAIKLHIPGDYVVELDENFSEPTLRRVLAVLSSSC